MTSRSILHRYIFASFVTLVGMTCLVSYPVAAVDRINQPISSANVSRLRGNVHPLATTATDLGKVGDSTQLGSMKLVFSPTAAQESALDTLLQQQQDPSSPNYHKWLTPEQFGDRFGLSQNDFNKIAAWLRGQGFQIVEAARSRTYITFSGTAAQVESAFRTPIHQYSVNGAVHFANASEPAIPVALAGVVSGVASLNNFRPKPRLVKPKPRVTSSVTGNHFMQPGDFATIYNLTGLYGSGIDGTGQTIAVMGQTDLYNCTVAGFTNTTCPAADVLANADIITFRTNTGLSAPNLKIVLVTTDPGLQTSDIDEADLDIEWAGGIAKNAQIIYVLGNPTTGNGTFDALPYAVTNNVAPVISISYGLCEPQLDSATQTLLTNSGKQANAQGQTIVAPSGDGGAADCESATASVATHGLAVDFPASMPYATSAGGSEFTGNPPGSDVAGTVVTNMDGSTTAQATTYWSGSSSVSDTKATALSYIAETVWNDTATDGVLSAGGGGVSTLFTKPTWQVGTGVPTDGQRDVPDISLSASADHDGYLICSQGSCSCGFRNSCTVTGNQGTFDPSGGTSAAVPAFAAIVALINQKTATNQGNVNPTLYSLAGTTPTPFHDITTGNNIVPCQQGTTNCPTTAPFQFGYSAAAGYDLASGLGSVDAGALVAAWTSTTNGGDFQIVANPTSLTLSSGGSGTSTITSSVVNGFAGTITLTCSVSSSLGATTCSLTPTTVAGPGSSTLTIHGATLAARLEKPRRFAPGAWSMESSFLFAAVLMVPFKRERSRSIRARYSINAFFGVVVLTLVLGLASCGGGGGSGGGQTTTPLSGTVTVTATSGTLTHTAQVAVTVN